MNALLAWSAPDARTDAVVDDLLYHGALHRRNFAGFAFAQAPEPAQEPDAFPVELTIPDHAVAAISGSYAYSCKDLDACLGRFNPPSLNHHFRA